jgi:hypothetical protein
LPSRWLSLNVSVLLATAGDGGNATLFMVGTVKEHLGKEGKTLRLASVTEIGEQKKMHSKLGPDFFHRL